MIFLGKPQVQSTFLNVPPSQEHIWHHGLLMGLQNFGSIYSLIP